MSVHLMVTAQLSCVFCCCYIVNLLHFGRLRMYKLVCTW